MLSVQSVNLEKSNHPAFQRRDNSQYEEALMLNEYCPDCQEDMFARSLNETKGFVQEQMDLINELKNEELPKKAQGFLGFLAKVGTAVISAIGVAIVGDKFFRGSGKLVSKLMSKIPEKYKPQVMYKVIAEKAATNKLGEKAITKFNAIKEWGSKKFSVAAEGVKPNMYQKMRLVYDKAASKMPKLPSWNGEKVSKGVAYALGAGTGGAELINAYSNNGEV